MWSSLSPVNQQVALLVPEVAGAFPFPIFAMASQETEIFTSLSAARSLLEQKGHRPLLLVEESALEDFTGGFQRRQLVTEPVAS